MTILKSFSTKLKTFCADSSGQIALGFGLAALPMLAATGIAFDYSQYTLTKAKLQQIADSAALAATAKYIKTGSESGLEALAQKYINENMKISGLGGVENIVPTVKMKGDFVELKIKGSFKTTFMKLMNVNTIELTTSQAGGSQGDAKVQSNVMLPVFNEEHRGEVALVMDYSSSMNEYVGGVRKYISMRTETNELFNQLTQNGTNIYVKFGLVPFSHVVRLTMPRQYFKGLTGTTNATYCIDDRSWTYNTSSNTPSTSTTSHASKFNRTDWYTGSRPSGMNGSSGGSLGDCPSGLSGLRPLGNDHAAIQTVVNTMTPSGMTHVALGLEMGWHVLTPNAPFTEGVTSLTSPYETTKAIILLTDGAQTAEAYGNGGASDRTDDNGDENLATNCALIKAQGIRILTVAFDLTTSADVNRLRTCASDDPKNPGQKLAWNPLTNAQLATAFDDIRKHLIRDVYVSK